MSGFEEPMYSQYGWKQEYSQYRITYGGFAIIGGPPVEGRPSIGVTQRNGQGGSPFLWNLPGGGMQPEVDKCLRDAARRELQEEIGILASPEDGVPIGDPLWLPVKKGEEIVRVDCAQGFLFNRGDQAPTLLAESLAFAWVHPESLFKGFRVVGLDADPAKKTFGRTPIMMWDGLSVLQEPFYKGPVTEEILAAGFRLTNPGEFLLIEGGRAFGRYNIATESVEVWNRLNPFEEGGRFKSELHNKLAK